MSKLFFNGRNETRHNHVQHNFKTKAEHKLGSKKFPLTLVVTSKERRQEVEGLVADAKLYANITLDTDQGAVESIDELSISLNKGVVVKRENKPKPNEPCSCGSGKKYKKCCR